MNVKISCISKAWISKLKCPNRLRQEAEDDACYAETSCFYLDFCAHKVLCLVSSFIQSYQAIRLFTDKYNGLLLLTGSRMPRRWTSWPFHLLYCYNRQAWKLGGKIWLFLREKLELNYFSLQMVLLLYIVDLLYHLMKLFFNWDFHKKFFWSNQKVQ